MALVPKETWIGFFIGAIIGSGGVLGYFFIDKKTQFSVDKEFIVLISDMYQKHSNLKNMSTVDMLQDVILPIYDSEEKYKKIIAKLILNFSKVVAEAGERTQSAGGAQSETSLLQSANKLSTQEAVQVLTDQNLIKPGTSVADIQENFSGDLRRQFSDKLVRSINSGTQVDVDRLLEAIVSKDRQLAYRINLYIAFTLARVTSWSGTPQQKQRFDKLKEYDLQKGGAGFNDDQFNLRVDQADKKFRPSR